MFKFIKRHAAKVGMVAGFAACAVAQHFNAPEPVHVVVVLAFWVSLFGGLVRAIDAN